VKRTKRVEWEYIRHGRNVPGMPPPLDLNPVLSLCALVAAFETQGKKKSGSTCAN